MINLTQFFRSGDHKEKPQKLEEKEGKKNIFPGKMMINLASILRKTGKRA